MPCRIADPQHFFRTPFLPVEHSIQGPQSPVSQWKSWLTVPLQLVRAQNLSTKIFSEDGIILEFKINLPAMKSKGTATEFSPPAGRYQPPLLGEWKLIPLKTNVGLESLIPWAPIHKSWLQRFLKVKMTSSVPWDRVEFFGERKSISFHILIYFK